jgi:hypothetical protein
VSRFIKQLVGVTSIAAVATVLSVAVPSSSGAFLPNSTASSTAGVLPVITVPLRGTGWTFSSLPAGVNPALTTQQLWHGVDSLTGCVFKRTGTAHPGFRGREEDEIAVNPSSCQAVVAIGPLQAAAARSGRPRPNSNIICEIRAKCPSGTVTAFYVKTWWTDPVSATVSSLRNDVTWLYWNGCDQSYTPKHSVSYLSETGWVSDYENNFTHLACGAAISNSNAEHENRPFCSLVFGDPEFVYLYYDYNHEVVGKPDGSAVYAYSDHGNSSWPGLCEPATLTWHNAEGFEAPFS